MSAIRCCLTTYPHHSRAWKNHKQVPSHTGSVVLTRGLSRGLSQNVHQVWANLWPWLELEDHFKDGGLVSLRRWRWLLEADPSLCHVDPSIGLLKCSQYGDQLCPKWAIFLWPRIRNRTLLLPLYYECIGQRDQHDTMWEGTPQGDTKKVRVMGGWWPWPLGLWSPICKMPLIMASTLQG